MAVGEVVGGRYRVVGGPPGRGRVAFAEEVGSGRPVVVEFPDGAPGPGVRLRHPGIVAVLETGVHEGRPFLVMERLDGHSLEDHLLDGWYRPHEVAGFGAQVAEALLVAHRAGLSHGALAADRLLLTPDGTVKVLGFGTPVPVPRPDLVALGDTLLELLGQPLIPSFRPEPGELDALIEELRAVPDDPPDPAVTAAFAARLRRLHRLHRLAAAAPSAAAAPPERPVRRARRIVRHPGRRTAALALLLLSGAALLAVAAYAAAAGF
ncbi:protein kinase [Kitasatospora sp. NPDC088134]|uniref:protein kinase n=1 Tax=Kitasatospora sp. NPDC088134 TaxID=3364071 RepID=UPI00380ADBA6